MNTHKITKFSKISNAIFLIISIFLLFFIWCNHYIKNIKTSLFSSIIFILSFLIIVLPINRVLNHKKSAKNLQKKKIEITINNLLFSSNDQILSLFQNILKYNSANIISQNHIYLDNKDIFFLFAEETPTEQDILSALKCRQSNIVEIYCINQPSNFRFFCDINIQFVDITTIQQLFDDHNIVFNENKSKKSKIRFNDILRTIFSKEKSRTYFNFGILILLSSMFTPYNIYYIVMSTILIIASIFCRFNTIFN